MILNADEYRINIPFITALTESLTPKERYEEISKLAVATGVPAIIVCIYLMEIYGHNVEIDALAERLKIFYTVSEVKGVKDYVRVT